MQQQRRYQNQNQLNQMSTGQQHDYTNDAFATVSSSSIDELMMETEGNHLKQQQQQQQQQLQQHSTLTDMLPLLRMPQLRCVFLRLVFTKIGDIDTVRECFDASVYLEAQWREPSLDAGGPTTADRGASSAGARVSEAASSDASAVAHWHPDLYIDNSIGDLMHRRERELTRNSIGEAFVLERHSLRGRFFERMELWHFPFDTQDITVTVCSNLPDTAVELQEMPDKPSRVFTSTFTDEQEWSLHTHVEASRTSVISDSQIGPRQRPAVQFSTRATRRATFYVVNIWFVSFILCMLALFVFGIDRQNLQGRLQLSFILLLTTVTFKFVIANHIPRVSYLTMLVHLFSKAPQHLYASSD